MYIHACVCVHVHIWTYTHMHTPGAYVCMAANTNSTELSASCKHLQCNTSWRLLVCFYHFEWHTLCCSAWWIFSFCTEHVQLVQNMFNLYRTCSTCTGHVERVYMHAWRSRVLEGVSIKIRTCIYICTYMQHYDYELHDTYSERNFSWSTAPGVPVCGCRIRVFWLFVRCRIRESCLSRLSLSIYLSIIVSLHLSINLSTPLLSSPSPPPHSLCFLAPFEISLSMSRCLSVSLSIPSCSRLWQASFVNRYGHTCRTQAHNHNHAGAKNHVCVGTRWLECMLNTRHDNRTPSRQNSSVWQHSLIGVYTHVEQNQKKGKQYRQKSCVYRNTLIGVYMCRKECVFFVCLCVCMYTYLGV